MDLVILIYDTHGPGNTSRIVPILLVLPGPCVSSTRLSTPACGRRAKPKHNLFDSILKCIVTRSFKFKMFFFLISVNVFYFHDKNDLESTQMLH